MFFRYIKYIYYPPIGFSYVVNVRSLKVSDPKYIQIVNKTVSVSEQVALAVLPCVAS